MTGQRSGPPVYLAVLLDPELEPLATRATGAGLGVGFGVGVGIGAPLAPGSTRTCPTTSVGSASPLRVTISDASTPYFAASESSVSVAPTVTTSPLTGGIRRTCPTWRASLAESLFAHHSVIVETLYARAIVTSVSPDFTV